MPRKRENESGIHEGAAAIGSIFGTADNPGVRKKGKKKTTTLKDDPAVMPKRMQERAMREQRRYYRNPNALK